MNRIFWWLLLAFLVQVPLLHGQDSNDKGKSKEIKTIDGTEYYIHTIQRGQTLYKIAKIYDTDMDLIISLNPEIREGLKPGMILKIPVNPGESRQKANQQAEPVVQTPPAELPCGMDPAKKKKVYHVALMMHFFLNDVDSLSLFSLPENPEAAYRPFEFIQFYEGFMMAVDSLQKLGFSAQIHVYDVSPDTVKTKEFLNNPELEQMDLMVGLLYNRNFQIVARYALAHKIPLVSPVSERESQVSGNPMVIKVRPGFSTLYSNVAEMITPAYRDAHVIVAREPQGRYSDDAAELAKLCQERNLDVVVTGSRTILDFLVKDRKNLVAIFTDSKSSALDLLTQLNSIKSQFDISVFGLPLWGRIDGLEVDYLVNLKTHIASHYFIDYSDPGVQWFVKTFQVQIKTDPDVLAFAGFDAGFYFLNALMKYGTDFRKCMNDMHLKLLHLDPVYTQSEGNGYENSRWMIYYYENFQVYPMVRP